MSRLTVNIDSDRGTIVQGGALFLGSITEIEFNGYSGDDPVLLLFRHDTQDDTLTPLTCSVVEDGVKVLKPVNAEIYELFEGRERPNETARVIAWVMDGENVSIHSEGEIVTVSIGAGAHAVAQGTMEITWSPITVDGSQVFLDSRQFYVGTRGLSAYEIAVKYGYSGTEEEWANSFAVNEQERQATFESNEQERQTTFESNEQERGEVYARNEQARQVTFEENEQSRAFQYSRNEGNSTSADESRWGQFNAHESKRQEAAHVITTKAEQLQNLELVKEKIDNAAENLVLVRGVEYYKDSFYKGYVPSSGVLPETRDPVDGTETWVWKDIPIAEYAHKKISIIAYCNFAAPVMFVHSDGRVSNAGVLAEKETETFLYVPSTAIVLIVNCDSSIVSPRVKLSEGRISVLESDVRECKECNTELNGYITKGFDSYFAGYLGSSADIPDFNSRKPASDSPDGWAWKDFDVSDHGGRNIAIEVKCNSIAPVFTVNSDNSRTVLYTDESVERQILALPNNAVTLIVNCDVKYISPYVNIGLGRIHDIEGPVSEIVDNLGTAESVIKPILEDETLEHGYLRPDGQIVAGESFRVSQMIEVAGGEKYRFYGTTYYTNYNGGLAYTKDHGIIGPIFSEDEGKNPKEGPVTMPEEAKYIRVTLSATELSEYGFCAETVAGCGTFSRLAISAERVYGLRASIRDNIIPSIEFGYEDIFDFYPDILHKPFGVTTSDVIFSFGDSITAGAGASTPYINIIANSFGMDKVNFGVNGMKATKEDGDTDRCLAERIDQAANSGTTPSIITCMIGVNDCRSNRNLGQLGDTVINTFYGALHTAATKMDEYWPTAKKVWIAPIRYLLKESGIGHLDSFRKAVMENAMLFRHSFVNGKKIPFPRLNGWWQERLLRDKLHPTDEGHVLIGQYLSGLLG